MFLTHDPFHREKGRGQDWDSVGVPGVLFRPDWRWFQAGRTWRVNVLVKSSWDVYSSRMKAWLWVLALLTCRFVPSPSGNSILVCTGWPSPLSGRSSSEWMSEPTDRWTEATERLSGRCRRDSWKPANWGLGGSNGKRQSPFKSGAFSP